MRVDGEYQENVGVCVSLRYAHACVHEAPAHPTQSRERVGDEHRGYERAHVQVIHDGVHAHGARSDESRRRQPSEKPLARIIHLLPHPVAPQRWPHR